jgi:hypothetical protein
MSKTFTEIYVWNDRSRTAYARLRLHDSHWRLEWGRREPPGGERELDMADVLPATRPKR